MTGPPITVADAAHGVCQEARAGAGRFAAACRCPQEVREIGFDAELDAMLRQAGSRR